jgi:hypothetical protein
VLPEAILLGIGVEAERAFGQVLALPGLHGGRHVRAPGGARRTGDAGDDQQAKPKTTVQHAGFLSRDLAGPPRRSRMRRAG